MKQNSAEQPYEAYERLKNELEEVNYFLQEIGKAGFFCFNKKKEVKIPDCVILSLIESAESNKQQIENELNKLVNG